jgi:hypothetical protein
MIECNVFLRTGIITCCSGAYRVQSSLSGDSSEACAASSISKNSILIRFLLYSPSWSKHCTGNEQLMVIKSCVHCMSSSVVLHSVPFIQFCYDFQLRMQGTSIYSLLRDNGAEVSRGEGC